MKKYCWEIYNKSECEACPYFRAFQEGKTEVETASFKDIVMVEEN